ncbi:MAG TPA: UDP-N-acetylmuramoyl-L-alanine--D-glutamate ligase, partial [Gammaproteobacteria bacterium]|nr:UDP-N-acetylmuramoyl-L-alanine--D-glutamate ligase [Gammaproteobacteria bacterium]
MQPAAATRSLIVGLGATGVAVARHLAASGEAVRVIDSRAAPPGLDELRAAVPAAESELGTLAARGLDGVARVLLSPGLA